MNVRAVFRFASILAVCFAFAPTIARAVVIYNEGGSGDAGVDPSSVALGSLSAGNHQVIGGNPNFDTDDYAFTVGSGLQLDAIVVDNYTAIGSAAIQTPFLGSTTLNSSSVGKNFLSLASIPQPVSAGSYLFRTTTGSGGPTTYQYSFQVSAVPAPGTIRYSESVSGDAGVEGAAPSFVLQPGSNRVVGVNQQFDTDDYSVTVPAGYQLDSILMETYGGIGSAAIQTPFLGSATLSTASVAQDFLDLAGVAQPIGPGTYLFRTTTGTAGPTSYRFDLQLSAVPEPEVLPLIAIGSVFFARRRRK